MANLKFQIVLLLITSYLLLASTPVALAATTPTPTCKPLFGGGIYNCNGSKLTVDKTVQDVQSGSFVQNLGVNDAHYSPESTVAFRIVVKNPSSDTIKNITVKDTLPQYVTYATGDGKYDSATKSLTITLASLPGGKTQTYDIKAKVANIKDLPQDQAVMCLTNQVIVKNADQTISDNAQFCIQRQATVGNTTQTTQNTSKGGQVVYPVTVNQTVKKTPPTGPEALALIALAPAGLFGAFLRRKAGK